MWNLPQYFYLAQMFVIIVFFFFFGRTWAATMPLIAAWCSVAHAFRGRNMNLICSRPDTFQWALQLSTTVRTFCFSTPKHWSSGWSQDWSMLGITQAFLLAWRSTGRHLMFLKRTDFWDFPVTSSSKCSVPVMLAPSSTVILSLILLPGVQGHIWRWHFVVLSGML